MNAFQRLIRSTRPAVFRWLRQVKAIVWRAIVKYDETDGEQRAASFAYYAFFAMFPLIVLLITVGTNYFGSRTEAASKIMAYITAYLPLDSDDANMLSGTIEGVVKSRKSAGIIAFGVLVWSALKFFQALVQGVNRAWGTKQYQWWRLPIKNLFMTTILASALLLGIVVPAVLQNIEDYYFIHSRKVGLDFGVFWYAFEIAKLAVPLLVLFYGMSMFYKFAPRRRTMLSEVWSAALFVTIAQGVLQRAFIIYTHNIGHFNRLYGTFGTVIALLLWIYLSGSIIILGGCICAAKYEIDMSLTDQSESSHPRD